jgi:hypothetical protein
MQTFIKSDNLSLFMQEIRLTKGFVAIVDDDKFELLNSMRWYACVSRNTVYAQRRFYRKDGTSEVVGMHRFLMNYPDGEVDHINGLGSDNRMENLRVVSHRENIVSGYERKEKMYSQLRGVTFDKQKKSHLKPWKSAIYREGKSINLGQFTTPEDAHQAYLHAKETHP